MINALVFGKTIISSKKTILGLEINKKFNKIYVAENPKDFQN